MINIIKKYWYLFLSALILIFTFLFGVKTQSKKVKIINKQNESLQKEIEIKEDSSKNEIKQKQEALENQSQKIKDIFKEQEELMDVIKAKELAREKQLKKDGKETDKILKEDYGIKEYKK